MAFGRNEEQKTYTAEDVEVLKSAIADQNKVAVKEMLEGKILKLVDDADRGEIYRGILGFHDVSLADYVVKNEKKLNLHFLGDAEEYKDRVFLQEFFEEYAGKFTVDEEDRERIFALAVDANAPALAEELLKKNPLDSYYAMAARGAEDVFDLLLHVKPKNISMDVKRDVALAALMADDNGPDRVEVLENHGWDFNQKMLKDDLTAALKDKRYANDRAGRLERQADEARMRFATRRVNLSEKELKQEDKENVRDRKMSLKELLTGREPEKTFTDLQRDRKKAQKLAREKKRRQKRG